MNFSEYVAVLSGNTDLLDKARLEKKIATLESERQAFVRGKSSSRYKLEQITEKIEKNNDLIRRIGKDLEHFKARVEFNEDGSYRNPVKLNGLETSDPKAHRETAQPYRRNGTHARQARTHREPLRVRAARPERNDRERRARPGAEPFLCPG